jgi:hypothetical protein
LILVRLPVGGFVAAHRLSGILMRLCRAALLRSSLIARLCCRWSSDVAICRKRLAYCQAGWTAMVDGRKLSPVGAGSTLILHLSPHGRSMRLMASRQFRRSGSHLQSARSAVEAHTGTAAAVPADGAVVEVVLH